MALPVPVARTPASNLPVEVLDLIFKHHFGDDPSLTTLLSGQSFSLVCRSWQGSAQRYLLKKIVILEADRMRELESSVVCEFIRDLRVEVEGGGESWSASTFASLLEKCPKLESLALHFNTGSPEDADYRSVATLELLQLKKLHLEAVDPSKHFCAFQQVLSATPNITSLSLAYAPRNSPDDQPYLPHTPSQITPLDLPSLRALQLSGTTFCLRLRTIGLLNDATLLRIVDFTFVNCYSIKVTKPDFLKIKDIERSARTVSFRGVGNGGTADHVMSSLTQVSRVRISHGFSPLNKLPASVKAIDYSNWCGSEGCLHQLCRRCVNPSTLERINIRDHDFLEDKMFSKLLEDFPVEVMVGGIVHKPDTSA